MAEKFICPACGQESFLKKEKVYQGFTETGERSVCAFCSQEISPDEISFLDKGLSDLFSDSGEKKVCKACVHYVINPFTQKCVLLKKYVEALDSCEQFSKKEK